jgi:hypothetical protein
MASQQSRNPVRFTHFFPACLPAWSPSFCLTKHAVSPVPHPILLLMELVAQCSVRVEENGVQDPIFLLGL